MISINPYEIILQIVNFGILYILLKRFLVKPLSEFLSNRANSIKHNLEFAEVSKRKAEKLLAENEEKVKEAQVEAQSIRKKAEESSKKELSAILVKGQQQSAQLIEQAKKDIDKQSDNARAALLQNVGDLVIKVVEKYVRNDVSKDSQKKTIDSLIKEVSN